MPPIARPHYRRRAQSGFLVTREAPLGGGKTIDLLATKAGRNIYVETETARSELAANVEKCRCLAGTVVFFAINQKVADALTLLLGSTGTVITPDHVKDLDRLS